MFYYIYVLENGSGKYYIGYTSDIEDRIERHNNNRSRYTSHKGPWVLVYKEKFLTKTEAICREKELKSKKSKQFLKRLIESRTRVGDVV